MSTTSLLPRLPSICILSPAAAEANNGNWHTASRWARMLGGHCRISIAQQWQGEACELLIALHARRSAPSIEAYSTAHPGRPLVVVLTGTDLYRDIRSDPAAQRSLELASHLVVLQDRGPLELEPELRAKCSVIYQSAPRLAAMTAPRPAAMARLPARPLRVVSVGHLRDEKDPATFMRAAARLRHRADIRFEQIGGALDATLADAAERTAAECPNYRWLGNLSHARTRQRIRRAGLLVNTSRIEGGAQVILEAAQSGTAVIASRIPGNLGMLGPDHTGWFEVGDDAQLAQAIEHAADDAGFLAALREETVARAPLFEPAEEERCLVALIDAALHGVARQPGTSAT